MKFLQTILLTLSLSFSILPSTAMAVLDEGFAAYKKQDYATAFREFKLLATKGNATAQFNLGVMYAKGRGVAQDEKEAVKWYRLAANQGDSDAQNNLASMYANGRGVAQDEKEAVKWFRLAANQGHADAKRYLSKYEELKKNEITESKRKAEEATRIEEEAKRKAELDKRIEEEVKRKAEEDKRIEEEFKRKAEEFKRKEEEDKRIAEELKRKELEKRKVERRARIFSWIATIIVLAGVIAFYIRRRKKMLAAPMFGNQRKVAQVGTNTADIGNEHGSHLAFYIRRLKQWWKCTEQDKFLIVVYPVLLISMAILIRVLELDTSHT